MRIVLANLSDKLYEESRLRLNASARRYGLEDIRSYDFEEIKQTPFYTANREILDRPEGLGYWLWKPYIILEAMKELAEGDIVIYCDSGIEVLAPLDPLVTLCKEREPVLLFGNGDFTNSLWTKRDCFLLMNCDEESYWYAPHCDASFCLFRKSPQCLQFLEEWMRFCCDKRILTDEPNTCGENNLPDFIQHRRDQAVVSLLARKYQLSLYRMPTQFGNHYKMPAYRVQDEFNVISQLRQSPVGYYATIPYYNSAYFQLLDHHRKKDALSEAKRSLSKGMSFPGKLKLLIKAFRYGSGPGPIRVKKNTKL